MINLENVLEMWKKDSVINDMNLADESKKSATLHQTYLNLYIRSKLRLKVQDAKYKSIYKYKWLYYTGKMSKERLDELNWEPDPLDGLKVMKSDLDKWFDSDRDLQEMEKKISYLKICVEALKEITDTIKWRHQTIKNIIEWKKFEAGI